MAYTSNHRGEEVHAGKRTHDGIKDALTRSRDHQMNEGKRLGVSPDWINPTHDGEGRRTDAFNGGPVIKFDAQLLGQVGDGKSGDVMIKRPGSEHTEWLPNSRLGLDFQKNPDLIGQTYPIHGVEDPQAKERGTDPITYSLGIQSKASEQAPMSEGVGKFRRVMGGK